MYRKGGSRRSEKCRTVPMNDDDEVPSLPGLGRSSEK